MMSDNKAERNNNESNKLKLSPLRRCQVHVTTPLSELVSSTTGIFACGKEEEGVMPPGTGADAQ
ncbi:hypothetical protein [Pseudodesulfovibrio pelocollis]|uniref:hypothetical protein n=1 Tax=Pseudodesulfovibrio pelocollis TaxID=3051432 RepID=UPI00255B21F5|nr:hypothetical protein [Pseudodesulfovibrio sp. SB368]